MRTVHRPAEPVKPVMLPAGMGRSAGQPAGRLPAAVGDLLAAAGDPLNEPPRPPWPSGALAAAEGPREVTPVVAETFAIGLEGLAVLLLVLVLLETLEPVLPVLPVLRVMVLLRLALMGIVCDVAAQPAVSAATKSTAARAEPGCLLRCIALPFLLR